MKDIDDKTKEQKKRWRYNRKNYFSHWATT